LGGRHFAIAARACLLASRIAAGPLLMGRAFHTTGSYDAVLCLVLVSNIDVGGIERGDVHAMTLRITKDKPSHRTRPEEHS